MSVKILYLSLSNMELEEGNLRLMKLALEGPQQHGLWYSTYAVASYSDPGKP